MSGDPTTLTAVARAAAARARADARLRVTVDDLMLPDDGRLDEQTRLALARLLTETIDAIETELRRQAARLLAARGTTASAEALLRGEGAAGRLMRTGLLRDEELIEALATAVRAQLLAADSAGGVTLAAEVQHRLVWWVAAAVRPADNDADTDRALAEAALRSLGAHDEGAGSGATAMRLAQAIDARPDELAPLLVEALGDRRLSLFTAVLAQAVGLGFVETQALVLEPEGERLWLALRAAQLDRATIARIALALSDADPRRDIEAFADEIDRIAAVAPGEARLALAPETLEPAFRGAIRALARSGKR